MTSTMPEGRAAREVGEPEPTTSPLRIVAFLLRNAALILGPAVLLGLAVAITQVAGGGKWFAEAVFQPVIPEMEAGRLAGLASQFGLSVGAGGGASVDFYERVLRSRDLLEQAVQTEYSVGDDDSGRTRGTLIDLYGVGGDTPAERESRAVRKLRENMGTGVDAAAGLVNLKVESNRPELAIGIAQRLLALLNEFNLDKRQSQAHAERVFVEERLESVREELRRSEEELQQFLESNRQWQGSPALVFERDRLQRQVEREQRVVFSLQDALEDARIREVRNTPVLTIIQSPDEARRDWLAAVRATLLAMLAGGMLGLGAAGVREYLRVAREDRPEEYRALVESLPWRRG